MKQLGDTMNYIQIVLAESKESKESKRAKDAIDPIEFIHMYLSQCVGLEEMDRVAHEILAAHADKS